MFDRIFEFLAEWARIFRCFTVVDEYQRAVILRWGKFHAEVGPGFHWLLPLCIDKVISDNVVARTKTLAAQSLVTSDGKQIVISVAVTSSINNIRKATIGVEHVDQALLDSCAGAIAETVINSSWDEIRSPEFNERLTKPCRKNAWRYGIEIERVQLADVSISPSLRVWLNTDKVAA
jgi:regulator of protease activity HflC (stomatin/prohibitin superfamily)